MKEGLPDTLEPHQWLSKVLPAKGKVGVDSLLISHSKWTQLSRKLGNAGHKLVPVSQNLVDSVSSFFLNLKVLSAGLAIMNDDRA